MLSIRNHIILLLIVSFIVAVPLSAQNPKVLLETSMGDIELELNPDKAPISVENFLSYVRDGHYSNTLFHRVIKGFMIQGGGFDTAMKRKPTKDPIQNEGKNGLKNDRGTIVYARTNVVNSATCQFFINLVDNDFLNYRDDANYGYAVFGKVTKGMNVVDKIAKVKTKTLPNGMADVPVTPVVILSAKVMGEEKEDQ